MDPMSITVVSRCCAASENIRDYFLEERYLLSLDQNEEANQQMLSITAIDLMLDELSDIGIETSFTAEDILQSEIDKQVMFYLRNKLDKDNLYNTIKSFNDNVYSEFCAVIENCQLAEDLLIELAEFMNATIPTDIPWDMIVRSTEYWFSTENFTKHISALQAKVDLHVDRNTSPIDDTNINEIKEFMNRMRQRDAMVRKLVSYIIKRTPNLDVPKLMKHVDKYDKDKLKPDVLPLFAKYNAEHPDEEPPYLKHHHENVYHHLEYWQKRSEEYEYLELKGPYGPSLEECVMIVVSLMLDGLSKDQMLKELNKFEPHVMQDQLHSMKILADIDYEQVLKGEIN